MQVLQCSHHLPDHLDYSSVHLVLPSQLNIPHPKPPLATAPLKGEHLFKVVA